MSLNGHWVAMSETQPWKFFALQRLNFQSLKLNFQFLEDNFKISEPCVVNLRLTGLVNCKLRLQKPNCGTVARQSKFNGSLVYPRLDTQIPAIAC